MQAPHVASEAGRSAGMRLTAEQWGQTAWMDSVMDGAPLMALANIWPQSAPFQALRERMRMDDHELVIIPRGNLRLPEAYWLQGL